MTKLTDNARSLLPLKPADFHILLALLEEDLHGYGMMQRVAEDSEGQVALEVGSLYRVVARLGKQGLLTAVRRAAGEDPRRRVYAITPLGRETAKLEAQRLQAVVRLVRARKHLERAASG
jgi:DNA-binding PadR family transcriptional regulator